MYLSDSHRKGLLAWFMIATLGLQAAAGLFGGIRSLLFPAEREMSAEEQAIAREIKTVTGLDVHIETWDDQSQDWQFKTGYGAPLLFAAQHEDDLCHYIIDYAPGRSVQFSKALFPMPGDEQSLQSPRMDEGLFAKFFSGQQQPTRLPEMPLAGKPGLYACSDWTVPGLSIPTPPPEPAA